ncbi:hypothetical protein M5K25_019772 [Dendrobium thyrsiflorum]|uniref:Uncharacterized protein n=1 Tax=Dendrobium thyrsiflorum TaxID=117978 RepID=A0ABD0UG42_DENTH
MDVRFAALEEMTKKMLKDKQKPATSETAGGHGRGENPNPFKGRENPKVEVLEGDDGMPPLEPLSREKMSMRYDRRGADFVGRMEEFHRRCADFEGRREEFYRRGADFEGRKGEYDKGFGCLLANSSITLGLLANSSISYHIAVAAVMRLPGKQEKLWMRVKTRDELAQFCCHVLDNIAAGLRCVVANDCWIVLSNANCTSHLWTSGEIFSFMLVYAA